VLGIISFAGAVGSPRPDYVCQPDRLIDADRTFGQTGRIPGVWIFARNDHFLGPELAGAMFDAYRTNGSPATLFEAPPYSNDGHTLFWSSDGTWGWPEVEPFLKSLHLPTDIQVRLAAPAHLADPVPLDDPGRTAFASYLPSRNYEKAFATDADGHFGFAYGARTKADAESTALKNCQKMNGICAIYAIGNELASARLTTGGKPEKQVTRSTSIPWTNASLSNRG
jgi:hypothetical protein